jgi:1-acyl-sn-glycerol-3-phosphate acyltransferase
MQALRSLLFLIIQLVVTPFYAIFVLLCAPLPAAKRYSAIMGWTWFFTQLADKLCGVRYQIIGKENIPAAQSLIVAAKHSSTWETLALSYMFRPGSFIAKRELLWIPFFGWGFALSSPITINRAAGNQAMAQMITQGARRVREGFNIIIFPEGTRIKAGVSGKYKTGCARLAIGLSESGANTLILPVAHNAGYCWPKGTFMKTPGLVTLSFLPPIDPSRMNVADLTAMLERVIETETQRLGDPRNAR